MQTKLRGRLRASGALTWLKQKHDALVIGVHCGDGTYLTNPDRAYQLWAGARLFVVAENRPQFVQ
jgi:hypothetical protein